MFVIVYSLAAALAGDYSAEIAVPVGPLPGVRTDADILTTRHLAKVQHADVAVSSTSPYLTCVVEDGWVIGEFRASAENWPALPVTGDCSLDGETLHLSAVAMSAATDPSFQSATLVQGGASFTKVQGANHWQGYPLPAGTWIAGTYTASLPGTRCVVSNATGTWMVSVRSFGSGALGTGACNLPRAGTSPYSLPITIGAAAI